MKLEQIQNNVGDGMIFGKLSSIKTQALMGAAVAVIATSNAQAQEAQQAEFDIEAKDLGSALTDFAMQSDVEVLFNGADVRGKKSTAVEGRYTPRRAIAILLNGTGVRYSQNADGTLLVGQSSVRRASTQNDAGAPAPVTGSVTDERTGNNLKGASVTIEETGQTATTDDLGNYRFPRVRPGTYTLRISYLGYQEILVPITVQAGRPFNQNFAMIGGNENVEIIVYGSRSARAQSLNQERTAENSQTVLSADFLGNFDGDTISEALRRAPGIAFEQDSVTGDGTNVIVRGLAPDLNTVTLNGLRLPEGSGTGRSANLGNILTDSISKITINKTLLPSQDSSGSGGLVEIETKGPLDRPRRFASFSLSGDKRGNGFRDEFLASGTVSGTFGADNNIGLSASVQYREQDIKRLSYDVNANLFGQYLPLAADGTPIAFDALIDPRTAFPFESGVDEIYPSFVFNSFNGASTSNLTVVLSGQWNIADHTQLRVDYTRAEEKRDSFTRSVVITPSSAYRLLPVDELGGEQRAALVAEDLLADFGFPGVIILPSQQYTIEKDRKDLTNTFSFRGETNLGPWELDYSLGFAKGNTTVPVRGSLSGGPSFFDSLANDYKPFLLPEALANVTSDGRVVHPYSPLIGDGYPLPLLNQAGFDLLNNSNSYAVTTGFLDSGSAGNNERYTAQASARYNFENDYFKYLEVGIFYENAEFNDPPVFSDDRFDILSSPTTFADLGFNLSEETLRDIGLDGGALAVGQSDIEAFFSSLSPAAAANLGLNLGSRPPQDPRFQEAFTKENNVSAYAQGRLDIGKLQIVAGARLDSVEITARSLRAPSLFDEFNQPDFDFLERFSTLVDQTASQTKILPRAALTYRHNDNLLIRAGYAVSVARPQIQNLSDTQSISLFLSPTGGINGDQPTLLVRQANPDLEPALTTSYDVSVEQYFDDVGQIKLSFFYKDIKNLLEQNVTRELDSLDGVVLPDDPRFQSLPSNIFVQVIKPVNADTTARIWGFETAIEKQFTFLPGALSGLGIFANYTYTDSSKTQPLEVFDFATRTFSTVDIEGVRFSGSPKHSGTVALTYNKYGFDAALSYTAQSRRLTGFDRFNLNFFDEADDSLDFRAEYRFKRFGSDWRVWVAGSDLLKGTGDPDVQASRGGTGSTPKYFTGGNYFGGRSVSAGLAVNF